MDVKSIFLNEPLEEEVYFIQPSGFKIKGQTSKVYRLRKTLYGLKQPLRAWNKRINSFLIEASFTKFVFEHEVYVNDSYRVSLIIICIYVDDLLITGANEAEIRRVKSMLIEDFEILDLGNLSYFLRKKFKHISEGVFMHQKKYSHDILKRIAMSNCNAATTPLETGAKLKKETYDKFLSVTMYKQIIGSLRYFCNTRPDICRTAGLFSRFMHKP